MTMYVLRGTGPDGTPIDCELSDAELVLGRSPDSDIVIGDPLVSGRHARIVVTDGQVRLDDLNSRNGTFVNDQRVQATTQLTPGDRIRVGGWTAELVSRDNGAEVPPTQLVGVTATAPAPAIDATVPEAIAPSPSPVVVLRGPNIERILADGQLTIGRAPTCDIVVDSPRVSREHARIKTRGRAFMLEDLTSRNGTYLNGERVEAAELSPGDEVTIGGIGLIVVDTASSRARVARQAEVVMPATELEVDEPLIVGRAPGVVPPELLERPIISEAALAAAGVDVTVAEYAALGAGLGSFMWVDLLRNSGVADGDVLVVGPEDKPYARYARLCQNSQIPSHERLRSNSESCPDNLWGFPSYGVREIWHDVSHGRLGEASNILWSLFGEPALAQTYTPRSGEVFRSIDREAQRIGWHRMWRRGRVRAIRKSQEGHLVAIVSESDEHRRKHTAIACRFLHLAMGYPAIQLLPDLATYRETYHDDRHVVNAYESHDHVYEQLRAKGGTVLLRGRGIVASRILQRVWEERHRNPNISVVHLHRSRLTRGHRYGWSRRLVEDQWECQPFNWPKGCWTGEHLQTLLHSSHDERKQLLDLWGGTTTADRHDWKRIIRDGLRDGWYRSEFGTVKDVSPSPGGGTITHISSILGGGGTLELHADFIVDCTGAVHDPLRNPVLADLKQTYQVAFNRLQHMQVSDTFEVEGLRHHDARAFACGVTTLGGPHAAVDSFLGLQYAAMRSVDAMQQYKPKGLHRLDGMYSLGQWLKWARGAQP
jgi:pSer/pThr/pTyr-binding forkhead associated (FHA) protein